jgi:hypothetical protein
LKKKENKLLENIINLLTGAAGIIDRHPAEGFLLE